MITFYSTEKGIGGVENLIINISIYLSRHTLSVKIFNYYDSYINKRLIEENINVIFYDLNAIGETNINQYINSEDVLFIFWMNLRNLKKIHRNPRIIFWVVFPTSLSSINQIRIFNFKFLTISLLKYLIKNGDIYFMDGECVESTSKNLNIKIDNPKYLPIPVWTIAKNIYFNNRYSKCYNNKYTITYIGRNVIWKVKPIKKVIKDIVDLNLPESVFKIVIITNSSTLFKKEIDILIEDLESYINVEYIIGMGGHEVQNFLIDISNLHISMGTACLDGARLGIPTIKIDMSYDDFPKGYKYKWIFESSEFSLGKEISFNSCFENGCTMKQVVNILNDDNKLIDISNKCISYVNENHNIESICKKILSASNTSKSRLNVFLSKTIRNIKSVSFIINYFSIKKHGI